MLYYIRVRDIPVFLITMTLWIGLFFVADGLGMVDAIMKTLAKMPAWLLTASVLGASFILMWPANLIWN